MIKNAPETLIEIKMRSYIERGLVHVNAIWFLYANKINTNMHLVVVRFLSTAKTASRMFGVKHARTCPQKPFLEPYMTTLLEKKGGTPSDAQ